MAQLKVYTGSEFAVGTLKRWDGSTWEEITGAGGISEDSLMAIWLNIGGSNSMSVQPYNPTLTQNNVIGVFFGGFIGMNNSRSDTDPDNAELIPNGSTADLELRSGSTILRTEVTFNTDETRNRATYYNFNLPFTGNLYEVTTASTIGVSFTSFSVTGKLAHVFRHNNSNFSPAILTAIVIP